MSYNNESYSLILNSQNATNATINGGVYNITYNINWDSLLPRKYKKYSLSWQFKSTNLNTCVFNASLSATTLTVNYVSFGLLYIGMQFLVTISASQTQLVTISALGTGTGGTGTYTINNIGVVGAALYYSVSGYNNNLAVFSNFGKSLCIDQTNNQSNCIGYIYSLTNPLSSNINSYYYYSCINDNNQIEINYPNNQALNIKITQLDFISNPSLLGNYVLQLYFSPILEGASISDENLLLAGRL